MNPGQGGPHGKRDEKVNNDGIIAILHFLL